MEKRRAIEFLEYLRQDRNLEGTIYGDALNMAIDALKAQLSQEGTTSDLISRQDAIDAFMNSVTPYGLIDDDGNIESGCKDKDVVEMLHNLPPAQPEPPWIPVSERLPEVHESGNSVSGIYMQSNPVLVYGTCEYEDNAQFHVVTYCDDLDGNTYWSTELDAITVSGVIAWMPLPTPYTK